MINIFDDYDNVEINYKNIFNLKILNDYKTRYKEVIKSTNKKINILNNENKDINEKIYYLQEEEKKIYNKIKKSKLFFCSDCYSKFNTYNEFNTHKEAYYPYGKRKNSQIKHYKCLKIKNKDDKLINIKKEIVIFNNKLFYNNLTLRTNNKLVSKYENRYQNVNDAIESIKKKCQQCHKNGQFLENCGCSYNHLLCDNCFDKIENKCPVCFDIITFEMCPICMRNKKELKNINCGNNHLICCDCYKLLLNNNKSCPYCRNNIH